MTRRKRGRPPKKFKPSPEMVKAIEGKDTLDAMKTIARGIFGNAKKRKRSG